MRHAMQKLSEKKIDAGRERVYRVVVATESGAEVPAAVYPERPGKERKSKEGVLESNSLGKVSKTGKTGKKRKRRRGRPPVPTLCGKCGRKRESWLAAIACCKGKGKRND